MQMQLPMRSEKGGGKVTSLDPELAGYIVYWRVTSHDEKDPAKIEFEVACSNDWTAIFPRYNMAQREAGRYIKQGWNPEELWIVTIYKDAVGRIIFPPSLLLKDLMKAQAVKDTFRQALA